MDHNLKDIDFDNPLNGSLLYILIQEEVTEPSTCDMSEAGYSKKSNIWNNKLRHMIKGSHANAKSACNISQLKLH